MKKLDKELWSSLLRIYRDFHDASFEKITFTDFGEPGKRNGAFSVEINISSLNTENNEWEEVLLKTTNVRKINFSYDTKYDYPNVRDDVGILWFNEEVYVNFGSAAFQPQSKNEVETEPMMFIGKDIYIEYPQ